MDDHDPQVGSPDPSFLSDLAAIADETEYRLPAAKGRKQIGVELEFVKNLEPEDLPRLLAESAPTTQQLVEIRAPHHRMAQLIAQGTENWEVALLTGYSPTYISRIKNEDPAFKELVESYIGMEEEKFADVLDRMRTLGLSAAEELQQRLTDNPADWTKRELMELEKLNLVEPAMRVADRMVDRRSGPSGAPGGGFNIAVNFVQAAPKEVQTIEIEAEKKDD